MVRDWSHDQSHVALTRSRVMDRRAHGNVRSAHREQCSSQSAQPLAVHQSPTAYGSSEAVATARGATMQFGDHWSDAPFSAIHHLQHNTSHVSNVPYIAVAQHCSTEVAVDPIVFLVVRRGSIRSLSLAYSGAKMVLFVGIRLLPTHVLLRGTISC